MKEDCRTPRRKVLVRILSTADCEMTAIKGLASDLCVILVKERSHLDVPVG